MKKVLGVIVLTAIIFGLNYIGVPGYIAALLIGFISSFSLLGRNQNGRVREKLALTAAFTTGAVVYFIVSGQAYGVYAGAVAYLAVGFGLTRLYKTDYRLWLNEILPSVLRFVMFERIGGAVSGLGYKLDIAGVAISVRYIEAIVLLIAFIVLQSKVTAYIALASQGTYGQREYEGYKFRKLKGFGKFVAVIAVVIVWFNPANILVIDNIKNSVFDSLTEFGGAGGSTVQTISDTNGTSLLTIKSDLPITDDKSALALLSSYDKELGGEVAFMGSDKLASGNTVYNFVQTSNGIPLYGGGKKLVVGEDNKPLYVVGTTKIGVDNLIVPSGAIGETQAENLINGYLDGDGITIGNAVKTWGVYDTSNAYSLAYSVPVSSDYGDGTTIAGNIIVNAVSGEIVDIRGFVTGKHESLSEIFAKIKDNGNFSASAFDEIVKSTDSIISGVDANAWLYRDVLISECEKYYINNGNESLGKKNAKAISKAFSTSGVDGENKDEGVISVDVSNRATIKGVVNCPNDIDEMFISHTSGTTQQYTVKSDVPVTLTVAKSNGEIVLSLPVFDEETFEIYPTGKDERYIVTLQSGSTYQKDAKAVSAPYIPNVLMAQPLAAAAFWEDWFTNTELANYQLTIKQLNTDLRVENGEPIFNMLSKIEASYNSSNASRFLALYRFDELSKMIHDQFYNDFANVYGQTYADLIDQSISSNALSIYAQMYMVYYRTYNAAFAQFAKQYSELESFEKAISDNCDKTAIAFILFGVQGKAENWGKNFTPDMLRLDKSTLKLNYLGSEVKGNKTFIKVNAVITKGGSTIINDDITLVLQHFGNAQTISDNGGNWVSNFIGSIGQYLTSGDYLGLDLSGIQIPEWKPQEPAKITTVVSLEMIEDRNLKKHNNFDEINASEYATVHEAWYKWLSAYWYDDTHGYDMIKERPALSIKSFVEILYMNKIRAEEMYKSLFETLASVNSYESELSDIMQIIIDGAKSGNDAFELTEDSKTLLFQLDSVNEINKFSRRLTNESTLKILESGKRLGVYNPELSSKASALLERLNNTQVVYKNELRSLASPAYLTDTMFTPKIGKSTYISLALSTVEFVANEAALKKRLDNTYSIFERYEQDFDNIFSLAYAYSVPEYDSNGPATPSQGDLDKWNEAPKFDWNISDAWDTISKQYNDLGKNSFNYNKASQYYADVGIGCIPVVAVGSIAETSWKYIRAVFNPNAKIKDEEIAVASTISNMIICYDIERVIFERKAYGVANISDDKVLDAIYLYLEIAWGQIDAYCGIQ